LERGPREPKSDAKLIPLSDMAKSFQGFFRKKRDFNGFSHKNRPKQRKNDGNSHKNTLRILPETAVPEHPAKKHPPYIYILLNVRARGMKDYQFSIVSFQFSYSILRSLYA
jgi:hypothetical protein